MAILQMLCYDAAMGQLVTFDYQQPLFYMVTLHKEKSSPPFSQIVDDPTHHYLSPTPLTLPLLQGIRTFHQSWHCIEPITCFTIMPDHLHLLIKIRDVPERRSLRILVWQLVRTLNRLLRETLAPTHPSLPESFFIKPWHDWIVKKPKQLTTFTRYIRENPKRRNLRMTHPGFFQHVREVTFLGHKWYAYGNITLLERPVLYPFQCSRRWQEDGPEWQHALLQAERLGPGCAGISTFMSPCEKACGNKIFKSGGGLILLCPEGFGDYWHPTRNKEKLCATGRMLFLSLYPPSSSKPDKATLYKRCHEMGDLIISHLPSH